MKAIYCSALTQANVWEGVVHGTAPLVEAVEDTAYDLENIAQEPVPHFTLVILRYWNRAIDGIKKHGNISVDKQKVRGHFHERVSKMNDRKREKAMSKQLAELRKAFDGFIVKSGQVLDPFFKSCGLDVKDVWLARHRRIMPRVGSLTFNEIFSSERIYDRFEPVRSRETHIRLDDAGLAQRLQNLLVNLPPVAPAYFSRPQVPPFVRQVGHGTARLLDQDAARRDVPRRQVVFPVGFASNDRPQAIAVERKIH